MHTVLPLDSDRPTRAEIHLSHLRHNLELTKALLKPQTDVMGVIKANAYGHGIIPVAKELLAGGATMLGVAFLEEGIFLRENGIKAPILVLGAINRDQIKDFIKYDLELAVPSIEKAEAIDLVAASMKKSAVVHLKVDTGMERIGVHSYNAENFFERVYSLKNLKIKGLFSHFATADSDLNFAKEQLKRFQSLIDLLDTKFSVPPLLHLANSAAIINLPESHLNLVRPGIMLYGYNPTPKKLDLKPVMYLKSKVAYFKVVPSGTGISYNHTFKTTKRTRIVTIPIGYGDGYFRLLSNKGEVVIRGKKYPVVGNVCMDQIMVNLGATGEAYNGDDVLLFGEMDGVTITLESLCEKIGTIPYELLCAINSRVPRIYL